MAEERWTSPAGHVVPILLEPTTMSSIPAYLRAVTIFEPKGNAAAEIAAHVARLARRRKPLLWSATAVVVVAIAVGSVVWLQNATPAGSGKHFVSKIAESEFVSAFVMPAHAIERTEYSLDPTARFPTDRGDVVQLERLGVWQTERRHQGIQRQSERDQYDRSADLARPYPALLRAG